MVSYLSAEVLKGYSLFFIFPALVIFPVFFIFVVIVLTVMLYCTFRRISLPSFYIIFESRLIPTLFLILGGIYFRVVFICCFILY